MSIKIRCPECGAEGRVKNQRAGTTVKCNMCGQPVKVPADAPRSSRKKPKAPTAAIASERAEPSAATPSVEPYSALPDEAFTEDYLAPTASEQVREGLSAYLLDRRVWALGVFVVGFAAVLWMVNWYTAYSDLVEKAEKDRDPVAAFQLARVYESGLLADADKSFELYKYAAVKNHPPAQVTLAEIYEYGTLVPADLEEAVYWYDRAAFRGQPRAFASLRRLADDGNMQARLHLGALYSDTQNVNHDYAEALVWFTKAAEAGSTEAQFIVGQRHADGKGTSQDLNRAAEWYGRAADGGEVRAQYALGQMYRSGTGVDADPQVALDWFAKAADNGHVPAAVRAGRMLYEGTEVERQAERAAKYFGIAAKSEHAERVQAAYYLGGMFFDGDGVPGDFMEADRLFLLAAKEDHARAQYCHAIILLNGEGGRVVDPLSPHFNEFATSAYWFRKSADTGKWPLPRAYPMEHSDYDFDPQYGLVLRDKKLRKEWPPPERTSS